MNFGKIASPAASRLLVIAGVVFFSIAFVSAFVDSISLFGSFPLASGSFLAAAVALLSASAWAMNRRMGSKAFLIILTGAALVSRLVWVLLVDTPPSSDFLFMHNAALAAAQGDFSFASSDYYTSWAYQLGFTMYEALIVKLFGTPVIILKVINVLWSTGTVALVYWTAGKTFNEFCGRAAAIAYAFYIPNIVMCSVLTNQHVSMFFFMLGCALLVHRGLSGKYGWLLIGLSFGIGHIMRPIGGIYLAALIVFVALFRAFPWSLQRSGPLLMRTAGIVVVFYLLQATVSQAFIQTGVTAYPLANREPYWKFVVGLNSESGGVWNAADGKHMRQFKLGEERNREERRVVLERLSNVGALPSLFARKFVSFWGGPDSSAFWSMEKLNMPKETERVNKLERAVYAAMCFFGAIGLLALVRDRQYEWHRLFLIVLFGYAAIHLLIEIQGRYRLDMMPILVLLQSCGVYAVYSRIATRLSSRTHRDQGVPM